MVSDIMKKLGLLAAFAASFLFLCGVVAFADPACPTGSDSPAELKSKILDFAAKHKLEHLILERRDGSVDLIGVLYKNLPAASIYVFVDGCGASYNIDLPPPLFKSIFAAVNGDSL
jgi:hypothetical protein